MEYLLFHLSVASLVRRIEELAGMERTPSRRYAYFPPMR